MSTTVILNGSNYIIPATGETGWQSNVSNYLIAIASGTLQPTGGNFTLTGTLNFGPNYGVLALYFGSRSLNRATAGVLRLSHSDLIDWRNNANTGNLSLGVNSSDLLTFNGQTFAAGAITSLTGDVTATGPGIAVSTVAAIQGVTVSGTTGTGNVVFSASPALVTPDLGTPSALVGTNITGTAAGLTAGNVTTNANLTGDVTSIGNVTTVAKIAGVAVGTPTGTGNIVFSNSPTLITPDLGTPSALVGTNITGTAAGLTAGHVTTNANLTGDVTSVGNATTLTNAPVIAKVLTGFTSGAGTVTSADSILSAFQKINGNVAALVSGVSSVFGRVGVVTAQNGDYSVGQVTGAAPLASPTFTGTVVIPTPFTLGAVSVTTTGTQLNYLNIASGITGTGTIVYSNTPTLITPNIGAATGASLSVSGQLTSTVVTGTAPLVVSSTTLVPNLYVARAVLADSATTNANLTGVITSVGNATSIASQTGTGTKFVVDTSPTLITPNIGAASGTSLNLSGLTISQAVVTDGSKNLVSLAYTNAATASTIMSRDANANTTVNSLIEGYATTATAAGTTTLTVASAQQQYFTGSTTQTVVLPVTSTLVLGQDFIIVNNSSGIVTVQSSGANTVQTMAANSIATVTCILTSGTSAASWNVIYSTSAAGGGSVTSVQVAGVNGLSFSGGPVTSSGTITAAFTAPTIQTFSASPTGTTNYSFTITAGNTASVGAVYTNNGHNYTLLKAMLVGDTTIYASGNGTPSASGTLTYSSGTHTGGNITFSAFAGAYVLPTTVVPLYLRARMVGGGGGGSTSGTAASTAATAGGNTTFGVSFLFANGGNPGVWNGSSGSGGNCGITGGGANGAQPGGAAGTEGGTVNVSGNIFMAGGMGGVSPFGGAGKGGGQLTNGGAAAANTGSGGGGGGTGTSTASNDAAGHGGGAGGFLDVIIFPALSSFYAWQVGAGGSGGAAGTNGNAGGNGGSGWLEIIEYYQ